jgi:GDP-L-fucose synthase
MPIVMEPMSTQKEETNVLYQKILVTGGTGLLGTGLRAIVSQYPERTFTFLSSRDCNLTKAEEVQHCVATHSPDAIIHFAALSGGVQYSTKYPATLLRDNLLMNSNVLEATRNNHVKKTVMTLSTGMYPPNALNPIKEEYIHDGYPHESNYSYSFAKRLIDPSIKAYRAEYGMNVIGLISNGIFGENANFRPEESIMLAALIRRFYENADKDTKIVIWGDGSPLREYTYSQDMARAFMWCLDHYDDSQILNIGSTEEYSVKETAYMIADILGVNRNRIEFDVSRPNGIYKKSTDNSRFLSLSGFQYTPFRVGLENAIEWFSRNYHQAGAVRL